MRTWVLAWVIACSSAPPPPLSATGSNAPAYTGAPERGPCHDAHECTLREVCGCDCEGVLLSAPRAVVCDESCPPHDVCKQYSLICDLPTQTCGAIPRSQ